MQIKLKPLEDQVLVIAGAASSIGLATALAASLRGAKLVLAAPSADLLDLIVDKINARGGDAIGVRTELATRESLEALALGAIRHFGRIDTWINDAGLSMYGRLDQVPEADGRALLDAHFFSMVNGSLIALHYLREHGGALINLGSEAADAAPAHDLYAVSKQAVKSFHDALRLEALNVHRAGVAVTLIQPTCVGALPEPEQVAETILAAATNATRDAKVGPSRVDTLFRAMTSAMDDRKRYGNVHGDVHGVRPGKAQHKH